jgi:protocatechuate 3,4-dioxygenase alpha subunit
MRLPLTGSQTVGPYFSIGMGELCCVDVPSLAGKPTLEVCGTLIDGEGIPIPDALLEIWCADEHGAYAASSNGDTCQGFTRVATSEDGKFFFSLAKPGKVPYDEDRFQAPHILISIYMRGLLRNLVTRMYFPDDAMNEDDPVLMQVPAARRRTLIADAAGDGLLVWNIAVQGEAETVFFAW